MVILIMCAYSRKFNLIEVIISLAFYKFVESIASFIFTDAQYSN